MNKERIRFVNCYLCGKRLQTKEAIRKPKRELGEDFFWCQPCIGKQFRKRVKLIKRRIESWQPD